MERNQNAFEQYQEIASTTAIYPNRGNNMVYPVLGLVGEAGEVAEKLKKIIRDKDGKFSQEDKELFQKELGDVLWYISAICGEMGLKLQDVAESNLRKLLDRQARNKLQGSGDVR